MEAIIQKLIKTASSICRIELTALWKLQALGRENMLALIVAAYALDGPHPQYDAHEHYWRQWLAGLNVEPALRRELQKLLDGCNSGPLLPLLRPTDWFEERIVYYISLLEEPFGRASQATISTGNDRTIKVVPLFPTGPKEQLSLTDPCLLKVWEYRLMRADAQILQTWRQRAAEGIPADALSLCSARYGEAFLFDPHVP